MTVLNEIVVMNAIATIVILIVLLTQLSELNERIDKLESIVGNMTCIIGKMILKDISDIFDK